MSRHPIDEDDFRRVYNLLWDANPADLLMQPEIVQKIPLVFAILAISVPALPLETLPATETDVNEFAHSFYLASRQALAISDGFEEGQADKALMMAEMLHCRHLLLVRRASEAQAALASSIARAYAAALHRGAAVVGVTEGSQEDVERQLMWQWVQISVYRRLRDYRAEQ